MTTRVLVDGRPSGVVAASDRGLQFGDGVFETVAVKDGVPGHWQAHLCRLRDGLERLRIPFRAFTELERESLEMCAGAREGVLKIIVTRGPAGRGYAIPDDGRPTRIVSLHPAPRFPESHCRQGVVVRWCDTRLAVNPALAGIKHLNRLEQVLARAEWRDPGIVEGLMRDTAGRVISATACNLFAVQDRSLLTPSLERCGVAGIMRGVIMEHARETGLPVETRDLTREQVGAAEELFLSNSLIGIWPVARLGDRQYGPGPLTRRLMHELAIYETN